LHDTITELVKKNFNLETKFVNGNTDMFPWTNDFIEENELGLAVIKMLSSVI
jgi:hypothetical protein